MPKWGAAHPVGRLLQAGLGGRSALSEGGAKHPAAAATEGVGI